MPSYPSHFLPSWSEDSASDALFHYTSATGLAGIFKSRSLWCTAYYCANDEQELAAARGVLTGIFREELYRLEREQDARIRTFHRRGVDPFEYAQHFESLLTSLTFGALCAYIACFCKPTGKEDFLHGLLSQWRGYGTDGGYALQFSRQKLEAALRGSQLRMYELADVHYSPENPLKDQLLNHKQAFLAAFGKHLDEFAEPIDSTKSTWTSPLPDLFNGPLESLIDHLVYTKNQHFSEEREVRLCAMRPARLDSDERKIDFFSRNGLLVPYITIPKEEQNILDCVDWILIGPGPRVESRFKSITTLVAESGKDIKVRAPHIPYTRL
jgi:hypothetical protein